MGTPVPAPLNTLQPIVAPFDGSVTPWQRQSGFHSSLILLEAAGKSAHFGDFTGLRFVQPLAEDFALVRTRLLADHCQKALCQHVGSVKRWAHLCQAREDRLLTCCSLGFAPQAPHRDLPLRHFLTRLLLLRRRLLAQRTQEFSHYCVAACVALLTDLGIQRRSRVTAFLPAFLQMGFVSIYLARARRALFALRESRSRRQLAHGFARQV